MSFKGYLEEIAFLLLFVFWHWLCLGLLLNMILLKLT